MRITINRRYLILHLVLSSICRHLSFTRCREKEFSLLVIHAVLALAKIAEEAWRTYTTITPIICVIRSQACAQHDNDNSSVRKVHNVIHGQFQNTRHFDILRAQFLRSRRGLCKVREISGRRDNDGSNYRAVSSQFHNIANVMNINYSFNCIVI